MASSGDVFRGSSPLSHIPVLYGIRPSMDIKRSDKFAGSEFGRACAPEGPATGRRWSTMTRKSIGAARF
jgi:hypothetical protein